MPKPAHRRPSKRSQGLADDLEQAFAQLPWSLLGVNGLGVADEPPGPDVPADFQPKLTFRMVARIQGFPDEWQFAGGKTARYRQVGNAFPPPVAAAVGGSIYSALSAGHRPPRRPACRGLFPRQHPPVVTGQGTLF
jgi:DNA (cytosine-5)-methyltransferase 1